MAEGSLATTRRDVELMETSPRAARNRCGCQRHGEASVLAQVLDRWEKPADIAPGTALSVMAKIDAEGRLLNLKWIRQSGTRRVDRSFINAFSEAARFAPPPAELDASQGVVFQYVEGER